MSSAETRVRTVQVPTGIGCVREVQGAEFVIEVWAHKSASPRIFRRGKIYAHLDTLS